MFNAKRATANSIINRTLSNANGIGTSKTAQRAESGLKGQNGHAISDKAHSVKELQNLRSITTQYVNHVKENFAGKVASNINADTAKDFLQAKAETVQPSTLNTYVSEMAKMADNMAKDGIGNLSREDITSLRNDFDTFKVHQDRAYQDTQSIIQEMKDTPFAVSTELQAEAGLRASDSLDSSKWSINEDNTLTIHGSKGGLDYTTAPLSPDLIDRVKEAQEEGYKANYSEYREAFKEAVTETGQDYTGTHGLRYNFAQDRIEELKAEGKTDDEAREQTSLELGHSRLEITEHYAPK